MNVRPLYDRILVKRSEEPTRSAGGLFLPESSTEKPPRGEILAVGQGRVGKDGDFEALSVKVGDTIVFGKYAGTEIKIDGTEHQIMRESEILGVIED